MKVVPWSVPGGSGPVGGRWSPTGKNSHKEHYEETGERQGGKGDKAFLEIAADEVAQVFIQLGSSECDALEEDVGEDPN